MSKRTTGAVLILIAEILLATQSNTAAIYDN